MSCTAPNAWDAIPHKKNAITHGHACAGNPTSTNAYTSGPAKCKLLVNESSTGISLNRRPFAEYAIAAFSRLSCLRRVWASQLKSCRFYIEITKTPDEGVLNNFGELIRGGLSKIQNAGRVHTKSVEDVDTVLNLIRLFFFALSHLKITVKVEL